MKDGTDAPSQTGHASRAGDDPLRARARAMLPADVFDFIDGGAHDERTIAANVNAWAEIALRPHALGRVDPNPATMALGTELAAPVFLAPTSYHRLVHPDGESATAAGARAAGSLLVASTRSSVPFSDIGASRVAWWLQVYVLADRGWTTEVIETARAHGCSALVLTVDAPVLGGRHRDERNAFSLRAHGVEMAHRPATAPSETDVEDLPGFSHDPTIALAEVEWLAGTGLPVVVKGVVRGDDARRCIGAGAAAVGVSNHGGRQLDTAIATARALPNVVESVGGDAEVFVDGGIRSGADVVKAVALGARAAMVGRPALWALATGGARGVTELLDRLRDEASLAMSTVGARSPADLTEASLARP